MIDCFIKRMTVLGLGLVFQPVLVTQTCTYNSNNIALQNMALQIFHQKTKTKTKQTNKKISFKEHTNSPPPPPTPNPPLKKKKKSNKRSHDTSECFDVSLKLSKLHVKK